MMMREAQHTCSAFHMFRMSQFWRALLNFQDDGVVSWALAYARAAYVYRTDEKKKNHGVECGNR